MDLLKDAALGGSRETLMALVQDLREFRYRLEAVMPFDEAQWIRQRGEAITAVLTQLAGMPPDGDLLNRMETEDLDAETQDGDVKDVRERAEPHGYEALTPDYIQYVSPSKYAKLSPQVQRWYRPYWVAQPTKAAAVSASSAGPAAAKIKDFTPAASCDSPELCEANRGCAGQYGTKQACSISAGNASSDPLAATPADMQVYRSIADGYAQDVAKSQGHPPIWPKARDIARIEDMSGEGHLRLVLDGDNDVIVEVFDEGRKRFASVEFCNPGAGGGGQSRHTRNALIAVMVAMEKDNRDNTRKAHPRYGSLTGDDRSKGAS